jgi:glyoxylase-like metal-dependent hydrolase (beta-lactamase superfamily II)
MSSDLSLDVYVSPYKPIVPVAPQLSPGTPTFPASSISLVSGERDAVLIDALITLDEARQAAGWIRSKGKRLTTIYITHGHGDHFFGLNTLLSAFPDARAVTLADVFPSVQAQYTPDFLAFWRQLFPDQIAEDLVIPEPLDGDVIELEGHELRPINVGQSDIYPSTVVHIPDLDAVAGGDVAYNRIHMWLAQMPKADHEARLGWIAAIDKIAALKPRVVVAGHKAPGTRDDDLGELIDGSKRYITDFDEAERQSASAQELVDRMLALHPDRGNPYTLWNAATEVFRAREQPLA